MPYYLISYYLSEKRSRLSGIRESTLKDIDAAWLHFKKKAEREHSGAQIKKFSVVMLSRHSDEVAAYLQSKRRPPIDGLGIMEKEP